MVTLSHSWLGVGGNGKNRIFFLEIDFLYELNIKTPGKSMQLPYANEAKS